MIELWALYVLILFMIAASVAAIEMNDLLQLVVDEGALIRALRSGKVRVAALDVFEKEPISQDNPLIKMDNVILTPHLGACNMEGMQRMALQVAEGVWKAMNGQRPDHPVVN